ncbi:MAG: cytochrome P450, partial [Betaproteobacteria bacterium]|nr:cytochrome P450 [Betaproteobacteria bacterium]
MTVIDANRPAAAALRRIDDLPGPRGLPWLGNMFQIEPKRFHLQLEQWCREFGAMFHLRAAGRHILVVADHALVATILRDRPDGFRRTIKLEKIGLEMGLPPGVFGASGDAWRAQRRMVMAGFDPAHVKGYFPSLLQVAQRLRGRWQKAARDQQAIDLQADLMRYTVDAIAGLAFGAEVNTLESDD